MTWLTLRLQRTELILLILISAAIIGAFVATHTDVVQQTSFYTIENCPVPLVGVGEYQSCYIEPSRLYNYVEGFLPAVVVLPLVIAVLLALPLIIELADRTYRLAWTQSQTRSVWARNKILLMMVLGTLLSALVAFVVTWWTDPRDLYWGTWARNSYDLRGILPIGNVIFALGLVLAIGTFIRQPIVTIVVTSIVYFLIRIPFGKEVRPGLVPTEVISVPGGNISQDASLWVLSGYLVDANGTRLENDQVRGLCPDQGPPMSATEAQAQNDAFQNCFTANGISNQLEVHPESHFWPLQLVETGVFLAFGLALIGFAVWYWLRRLE